MVAADENRRHKFPISYFFKVDPPSPHSTPPKKLRNHYSGSQKQLKLRRTFTQIKMEKKRRKKRRKEKRKEREKEKERETGRDRERETERTTTTTKFTN